MDIATFLKHPHINKFNFSNSTIMIKLHEIHNCLVERNRKITKNSIKLELRKHFSAEFKSNQKDFWLVRGWTTDEANLKVKELQQGRTPNQLAYWFKKGYSLETAKVEISKFQLKQTMKTVVGSRRGQYSKEWFKTRYGDEWELKYREHNEKKTKKIKKSNMSVEEWDNLVNKKKNTYYAKSDDERNAINQERTKGLITGNNALYSESDFIIKFGEEVGKTRWAERNAKISVSQQENSSFKNSEVQDKCKETMLERYGVCHAMHVPEIKSRMMETTNENFACEERKNEILSKRAETITENYGSIENYNQVVGEAFNKTIYAKLGGKEYSKEMLIEDLKTLSPTEIAEKYEVTHDYVMRRIRFFGVEYTADNISTPHKKIRNILIENNIEFLENKRILDGKEIDIWIPSKNIGIEINGIFWHSEINGKKDENYHLNKTKSAEAKGIKLLHFMDREISYKFEAVKSLILNELTSDTHLTTNKLHIEPVNDIIKTEFLNAKHILGDDISPLNIGLFVDDKMASLLCFEESEKNNFELLRFFGTNKEFEFLWNYFLEKYSPKSVIVKIDRRYFDTKLYSTVGFNVVEVSPPNYYLLDKNYKFLSLVKNETWEKLKEDGCDRIWDCGSTTMRWSR